jgi:hypothetical protein
VDNFILCTLSDLKAAFQSFPELPPPPPGVNKYAKFEFDSLRPPNAPTDPQTCILGFPAKRLRIAHFQRAEVDCMRKHIRGGCEYLLAPVRSVNGE